MSKIPKAKCEKCEHCKLLTEYNVVICDYINKLYGHLYGHAYCKPKLCPNFKKRKGG